MWLHLLEVSSIGPIKWLFAVLLAVDMVLTLVHTWQELKGRLWRYFGAIAGVPVPDLVGIPVFFVTLTVGLWAVGLMGIAGWLPYIGSIPPSTSIMCVGGLIGGRLSDSWFSHIRLDRQGYSPNPGLKSTPYYIAEALILAVVFARGLVGLGSGAIIGLGVGILFFFSVLPVLRILRVFPSLRREPWKPGQPMPSPVR